MRGKTWFLAPIEVLSLQTNTTVARFAPMTEINSARTLHLKVPARTRETVGMYIPLSLVGKGALLRWFRGIAQDTEDALFTEQSAKVVFTYHKARSQAEDWQSTCGDELSPSRAN